MDSYRILFIGDVVGKPGRRVLRERLPALCDDLRPLFVVANAENAAGGVGVTPDIVEELLSFGIHALTLGNHAFQKREICEYLDQGRPIVRPANMPAGVPGRGTVTLKRQGVTLAVTNLCGRVFMDAYDDPFAKADAIAGELDTPHWLVDFHAEATSEKIAMAFHLEGRATAVVGTHTHVTTADERVLPGGTAAITDVGMTGPPNGVLGMEREPILKRFRTGLPVRFEVANEPGVISAVAIDVQFDTGRATSIRRIRAD
ncbi:MAG: TIGR00282 family metallophosphoesterase [Fimbriimonadales bacterium]|nr:TIGR00282 family metallophosphoesterase [Fimbriimonadales bacterium]